MAWEVAMREAAPHRDGPGGVLVDLVDGGQRSTYARVAWDRRRSRNPLRTFKRQLRDALARAQGEADRLNGGAP